MKKLIQAAGVLTAGAATLCSTSALLAQDGGRPWSVSAAVKGFYDDNMFAAPDDRPVINGAGQIVGYVKNPGKVDSFGFEVSPSVKLNLALEQTYISAGYQYGMRWYEARSRDEVDQYHLINLDLSHTFSPRFKLDVYDSLAVAQEPEQLSGSQAGGGYVPFRTRGDNIRNNAGIDFTAELTRPLSTVVSYHNNLYDFADNPGTDPSGNSLVTGSFGLLLDRVEHLFGGALRYQLLPQTVGLVGYQYGITEYSHRERETSDNNAHYIFGGVEHNFTSQIMAALRAGARITQFDNLERLGGGVKNVTDTTPYIDANVRYNYTVNSYAQVGVRHDRTATDVPFAGAVVVTDAQTTSVYGSLSHAFTGKLRGSVIAQFQHSTYKENGDISSNFDEDYFGVGASISYQFTRWLSGEANYYFDDRDSSVYDGRALDYTRHRVFLGVRFTY